MELNIKILMKDLSGIQHYKVSDRFMERNLESYLIYRENMTLHGNLLYILTEKNLLEPFVKTACDEWITAICLWTDPDLFYGEKREYLFLDDSTPLYTILDELEQLMEKYDHWETELTYSLTHVGTISDLCRISLPIFNNPIMVHNRDYEIMGSAESQTIQFSYSVKEQGTDYLNESVTKELFFRRDYLQAMEYHMPQYWLDDEDDMISIYANIFDENQDYWGRIIIDGVNEPLMDGHLALLSVLAEAVRILALKQPSNRSNTRKTLKRFVLQYIQDPQTFQQNKLLNMMHLNGWHRKDRFFCVCAETTTQRLQMNSIEYESMIFDRHFHHYLSLKWNGKLFLICNLALSRHGREKECRELAYIIRENLYISGISVEFEDFFDFPDYFAQSQAALRAGKEKDGTRWLFKFEDYALSYVLHHGASTLPLKALIPQDIIRLIQYDKKHDTSYYKTLKNYIEYNAHTGKAIDDLYIHRSTFQNRMKKIKSILSIDLENYEERIYLMIVFRLLTFHEDFIEEKE